ncbi:MAG: hypothetical protein IMW92_11270 [Bacillales bacterium]|nr:hypothetical protein [Bacillales bacterium]
MKITKNILHAKNAGGGPKKRERADEMVNQLFFWKNRPSATIIRIGNEDKRQGEKKL